MKRLIITINPWIVPVKWFRQFDSPALKVTKNAVSQRLGITKAKLPCGSFIRNFKIQLKPAANKHRQYHNNYSASGHVKQILLELQHCAHNRMSSNLSETETSQTDYYSQQLVQCVHCWMSTLLNEKVECYQSDTTSLVQFRPRMRFQSPQTVFVTL